LNKQKIHRRSDNVFSDIGVIHPERVLARAQIMYRIAEIIKERNLTQKKQPSFWAFPNPKFPVL